MRGFPFLFLMIDIREAQEGIIDMDHPIDLDHPIDMVTLGQGTNMVILNHGAETTSLDPVEETIIVKEISV